MNKDINLTIKLPQDPDEYIFKILTDNIALCAEGKAMKAFADDNDIKMRFFWHDTPAQYVIRDNTVYCDRGIGRDRLVGAMAREFRLASHIRRDPDLINVLDGRLSRVQLHRQAMLMRVMEGDAHSYELCMRAALQERGAIVNGAASMIGLTSVQARKLGKTQESLKDLTPAQLEVYLYACDFIDRHGKDPFSPAARREAFLFFQRSLHFREKIDAEMIGKYAVGSGVGLPRCRAFTYAARRPLPDTAAALLDIATCGLAKDSPAYLSKREAAEMTLLIAKSLHPALAKMIKVTDRKVTQALEKSFGITSKNLLTPKNLQK